MPINSLAQLKKSLLYADSRSIPMAYDIPANCQIFGQLAYHAGVEAILYPSVMTGNKSCLAIYPMNFAHSQSFVELADSHPAELINNRIDSSTYTNFI